jgi:hypothetical protein
MAAKGIQLPALRELAQAGAVRQVLAVAVPGGGWVLQVRYGMHERPLLAQRGGVREFRRLDTIAGLVRDELGMRELSVHVVA